MKIEVLRKRLFWYWRVVAANGQILATSEVYFSKSNAWRIATKLGFAFGVPVEPE